MNPCLIVVIKRRTMHLLTLGQTMTQLENAVNISFRSVSVNSRLHMLHYIALPERTNSPTPSQRVIIHRIPSLLPFIGFAFYSL